MIAADIVVVDIDPVRGDGSELIEYWTELVIGRKVGSQFTDHGVLLQSSARSGHGHALEFGQLNDGRSDRACRARDEDHLAASDIALTIILAALIVIAALDLRKQAKSA
jgi:hypothetical protein